MEKNRTALKRQVHESYRDLLKSYQWKERAEEIKRIHGYQCWNCGIDEHNGNLEVHHLGYRNNRDPWDYEDSELLPLCRMCHGNFHKFADDMWNEVLKCRNQWIIYECFKAVRKIVDRNNQQ